MSTSKLRIASLDFPDIKKSFVEYLKNTPEFTDHNFEASGLSVLLDVMAYNTHYQALMANFLANEIYMDTAVKRTSVVSRAKELGYTPYSKRAAKATFDLVVTNVPGNPAPSSLVLPINTSFDATINDENLTFVTIQSYAANRVGSSYTFKNVEVYEGAYVINKFTYNGSDPTIDMPNIDIDTSTLRVWVQDSSSTSPVEFDPAYSFVEVDAGSQVFFVQEGWDKKFQIYFGDSVIGVQPETGATITIAGVVTSGDTGNNANSFLLKSILKDTDTNTSFLCSNITPSAGGRDRESVSSIKLNATNQFGTQNRAVIPADYKALILGSGINVKSVNVWGGENNDPVRFGTVIVCAEPSVGDALTNSQKTFLIAMLKQKAVANIGIEFADPEYVDIAVTTKIKYDKTVLDIGVYDLERKTQNAILNYANNDAHQFDATFRYSNMLKEIDRADRSILSNETKLELQHAFSPRLFIRNVHSIKFNNPLNNNQKQVAMRSSAFTISEYAGLVMLKDNSLGNVHAYSTDSAGSIAKANVGTINYNTGSISINGITITSYVGDQLTLYATPLYNDLKAARNIMLRVQSDKVTVIAEAE